MSLDTARDLAQEVLDVHGDQIGTHYEGCWRYHVACFAVLMLDALEESP